MHSTIATDYSYRINIFPAPNKYNILVVQAAHVKKLLHQQDNYRRLGFIRSSRNFYRK